VHIAGAEFSRSEQAAARRDARSLDPDPGEPRDVCILVEPDIGAHNGN
jgi:hypothetical protein